MNEVSVRELVEKLRLTVVSGDEYLDRTVHVSDLMRPGVELTGYFAYHDETRIQVFGKTEISYLSDMPHQQAEEIMEKLARKQTPAFIVTRSLEVPDVLMTAADHAGIPVLSVSTATTSFISKLTDYLESRLAVRESVHGVFLDIFGQGVLITGDSGVGKSETALELIKNGHRLVADDRIDFYQVDELTVIGESPQILKNLLEVRGVGIIDVMTLFGVGAVKDTKKLDLIIHLEMWDTEKVFDRLGNNQDTVKILHVEVPKIKVPVKLGRSITNIVEVATMNFRAKEMGFDATQTFQNNLSQLIAQNKEV